MGSKLIRVDDELEYELKKIRSKISEILGQDVNISSTQSSKIAAKILRDKNTEINAQIVKPRKGKLDLIL